MQEERQDLFSLQLQCETLELSLRNRELEINCEADQLMRKEEELRELEGRIKQQEKDIKKEKGRLERREQQVFASFLLSFAPGSAFWAGSSRGGGVHSAGG